MSYIYIIWKDPATNELTHIWTSCKGRADEVERNLNNASIFYVKVSGDLCVSGNGFAVSHQLPEDVERSREAEEVSTKEGL